MERILLVDNDVEFLDILRRFFLLKKYDVTALLDSNTASDQVASTAFNVAIMDFASSNGNDLQLVQQLRGSPSLPAVIVLSGLTSSDHIAAAKQLGVDTYLTKPRTLRQIDAAVRAAMAAREARFEMQN